MHIISVEALNRLTQNILEAAGTPTDLTQAVCESLDVIGNKSSAIFFAANGANDR